jgi:hypothetical protein
LRVFYIAVEGWNALRCAIFCCSGSLKGIAPRFFNCSGRLKGIASHIRVLNCDVPHVLCIKKSRALFGPGQEEEKYQT